MSNRHPIKSARRERLREERIGSDAFCLFCGYASLPCLTRVSRKWLESKGVSSTTLNRLFERHHVIGQAHDLDLLITLCLNCHREITEGLAREGVSMRPERNVRKLAALKFRASAVLFDSLASSYRKFASLLEDQE